MAPTTTMEEQAQLIAVLEDCANTFKKIQANLKKCPKARLTAGYLEARMKTIEEHWQTFKTYHNELVKISTKELKATLPYFLNEEFFIYEELYNILQGDLKDMLLQLKESSSEPTQQFSSNISVNNSQFASAQVHLPKIVLPSFSGTYEGWPTFNDLFISLVHNNTSLSDVQKLHYLKTSVTGEAETLLKHIQITSNNYNSAWDILKERYGNKRMIINNTMKRLFNQRKLTSQSAVQMKGLLDTTTECLNTLNNLEVNTESWDPIIIHLLVQKLDPETHRYWEEYSYKDEAESLPTWPQFKKFIESKFRTLEMISTSTTKETKPNNQRSYHVTTPTTRTCIMCKDNHTLSHCSEFTKLEPIERSKFATNNCLCFNCLVPGHAATACRLPVSCRICRRRHHSLLHNNNKPEPATKPRTIQTPLASQHVVDEKEEQDEEEVQVNTMATSQINTRQSVSLLATAVVEAISEQGNIIPLRALIDQGSQATFISERATQLLQLKKQPMKGNVIGVGSTRTEIKHVVQLQIRSQWDSNFSLPVKAYVMSKQLTTKIPARTITTQQWTHLKGLKLADPSYFTPGSVDLLIGVKEIAQILENQYIKGPPGTPCAQKTSLGWILFGEISSKPTEDTYVVMHHNIEVDDMLKALWEIDTSNKRDLTKEEKQCEQIYETTYKRTDEGRYILKLPFKTEDPKSPEGNTKEIAKHRLIQLERRFKRTPQLKEDYKKVMKEYITLEHMEEITNDETKKEKAVYLPHHAVIREDKETSKTRVVFDASAKGYNQVSLNDELLVGPQLQDDLRNLIMRWRLKHICYASDIKMMYRQCLVFQEDADRYQRILWRENETDDIKEYRMLRVTFGTASAPYLAVKTLFQVADDEGRDHPEAAKTIKEDFYMDDLLSGNDTTEEAIVRAQEVTNILKQAGFTLSKWVSNCPEFMRSIEPNERSSNANLDFKLDGMIKALGVTWNIGTDQFQYQLNLPAITNNITKRTILSDIQKLFDPLGWIAPSLILAKILIQKLWLEKVSWDDAISQPVKEQWKTIREDFKNIKEIQIDRWLGTRINKMKNIQVHGFSDASIQAYAAVAYLRVENDDGTITTKIIAARTRVAPLRTVSLPRLELSGALLLSRLLKQIEQAMRIPTTQMYAWTDSSIVIAWLSGEPHRWKTFVANRVVEILETIHSKRWYHVPSEENPADIASRGMLLTDLKDAKLWWRGPAWLTEKEIKLEHTTYSTVHEMKKENVQVNLNIDNEELTENTITEKFDQFENLKELTKVIAYCKRFLNSKKSDNKENNLTTEELNKALLTCIKLAQKEDYSDEINRIKENKEINKHSNIKTLNPYLDMDGILRVGGRLRHANINEEQKYPIILGNKNKLVKMIVADAHTTTLHGGVQLMLSYLRTKYWIIRAKGLVKTCIHKCLVCAKLNAKTKVQKFGNLPEVRVTPARVFLHSGLDFCGPYLTLMNKGRGSKTIKTYVAIFICMATKAIHIELVGDLTSEAFIGAFRRFVARRGRCSHLWSDQGRNFVGANKELVNAWTEAKLQFTGDIAQTLATDGTQWHFIPAYSPHHGGLWEAGVKSIKHHLKRIITTHLTYEEMTTVLCQVEACLNSRPLCPIDDTDPENLNVLTPGHFLIGETPIVVPSPDMKEAKVSNLSRWQHTQKLVNDFWRRWQDEYLSRLQQRPKWLKTQKELKIGDIVLIKSDGLPPGKWSMGRIVDKHPGSDGLTRVYSVKSGSSITRRPITKLCELPIDNN